MENLEINNISLNSKTPVAVSVSNATKTFTLKATMRYIVLAGHPLRNDGGVYLVDAYNSSNAEVLPIKTSNNVQISQSNLTLTIITTIDLKVTLVEISNWQ